MPRSARPPRGRARTARAVFGSRATSGPRDTRQALKRPWRRPDGIGAPFARSSGSTGCPPTIVGCRAENPSRYRTVRHAPEGPFFHAGQREPRAEYRTCAERSRSRRDRTIDAALRGVLRRTRRPLKARPRWVFGAREERRGAERTELAEDGEERRGRRENVTTDLAEDGKKRRGRRENVTTDLAEDGEERRGRRVNVTTDLAEDGEERRGRGDARVAAAAHVQMRAR